MARAKRKFCIIAYDIVEDRKRNKISKILEKYGIRINYSVFECMLSDSDLIRIQEEISEWIDPKEDMIIYYQLCVNCFTKIQYQPTRREAGQIIRIV